MCGLLSFTLSWWTEADMVEGDEGGRERGGGKGEGVCMATPVHISGIVGRFWAAMTWAFIGALHTNQGPFMVLKQLYTLHTTTLYTTTTKSCGRFSDIYLNTLYNHNKIMWQIQ